MEDLTLWVMEWVARMSRAHKFTVGERMAGTCLGVTCAPVDATYVCNRRALLARASKAVMRARVPVRLGAASEKQAGYFAAQSHEVGKMPGGWALTLAARYAFRHGKQMPRG
jgi:hypothetical protein